MNYKIVSSGSSGNCVVINDVMVDCGVPYYKIKDILYDIKYLILTHIHSDHINKVTMMRIVKQFPHIRIIGNYEVYQNFPVHIIANHGFDIQTEDYVFTPFELVHDVLTYGYTWTFEKQEIIYATDTSSLENAPRKKYDYLFIESNHDEYKLEQARNSYKGTYNPFLSGKRHLSTQQAKNFFYTHRRSAESQFIELHKSTRFY